MHLSSFHDVFSCMVLVVMIDGIVSDSVNNMLYSCIVKYHVQQLV